VNQHQAEAENKIDLLNRVLSGTYDDAKAGMIGFVNRYGMNWSKHELETVLRLDRSEEYCEVPNLKAFLVHERLRAICVDIIMEIYEQPE
jgi:hypothetical protein